MQGILEFTNHADIMTPSNLHISSQRVAETFSFYLVDKETPSELKLLVQDTFWKVIVESGLQARTVCF